MPARTPTILLSFDVEEFDAPVSRGRSMSMSEQMERGGRGYERVLDLLETLEVPATMFTTGNFANWHPSLVRRAARRHETASHGLMHATFERSDLAESRRVLEQATGSPVKGFRRARLQPTPPEWIVEAGYRYDSSENPVWIPGRYNHLRDPRLPYRKGELVEVPISASPTLRVPLFWLAMKNLPMAVVRSASLRCLERDGLLNVFWHPWEFIALGGEGLPRIMRRVDGEAMCDRVARYVEWLRPHGTFSTFSQWLDRGAPGLEPAV